MSVEPVATTFAGVESTSGGVAATHWSSPAGVVRVAARTRALRIALAGCGTVGGSFVRLMRERGPELERTRGVRLELVRILVRDPARPRGLGLERALLTSDPEVLLAEDVDVVVEAIGGLDPAERLARATLARGRALVTANKELLAAAGVELAALAERTGALFDFEAAVAGGVPVVRALRGALGESGILGVRGILNGTTNYLLDRLAQGATYAQALAEAQAKGFAEPNPARDVDGRDAAAKIGVLAWLAFGADPARLPVRRRGLLPEPDLLGRAAALFGAAPKLLAECVLAGERVVAAVEPAAVDPASELGGVRAEHNFVEVETAWNGRIRLAGPGAGGAPTASALLSDVLRTAGPLPPATPRAAGAAADGRALPWIIALRTGPANSLSPAALETALADAAVEVREQRAAPGVAAAATGPVPWPALAAAAESLAARGARLAVLRDARAA